MVNPKKYKRLFTFGCSFTEHEWPTWADIMGWEIGKHYQYGCSGGGNDLIAMSIPEADAKHRFTEDDLVMVMWTTKWRESRIDERNYWQTVGDLHSQEEYSENSMKEFLCSDDYYYRRDLAHMMNASIYLKARSCDFEMMSMIPHLQLISSSGYVPKPTPLRLQWIQELYKPHLRHIHKSVWERLYEDDGWEWIPIIDTSEGDGDYHPTPKKQLDYLRMTFPNLELSRNVVNKVNQAERIVRTGRMKLIRERYPRKWRNRPGVWHGQ